MIECGSVAEGCGTQTHGGSDRQDHFSMSFPRAAALLAYVFSFGRSRSPIRYPGKRMAAEEHGSMSGESGT